MNQVAEDAQSRAFEAAIRSACEFALVEHGVKKQHVRASFLFGSRSKGFARAGSDVDLILIVEDNPAYPKFSYRRLCCDGRSIDSNIVSASHINELCRYDVDWAYRLYRAQYLREFSQGPETLFTAWIERINALTESAAACRHRLLCHIRECRSLLRSARDLDNGEPSVASYLMAEAVFLLPIIFLNHCQSVPYQEGEPWAEAGLLRSWADADLAAQYDQLTADVACSEFFSSVPRLGSFEYALKSLRDKCRTVAVRFAGCAFDNGYGGTLGNALSRNPEARHRLQELLPVRTESFEKLITATNQWLSSARRPRSGQAAASRPGHGKRSKKTEPRHIDYDGDSSRLKLIIPTGGCRVPVCSFCMLPFLARSKTDIRELLNSAARTHEGKAIRQLAVYTDGSFFDDRELNNDERSMVASAAVRMGAEELLVESLPRFVSGERIGRMRDCLGPNCQLRLGVGIQSTNSLIRKHVTRTPISQDELHGLMELRQSASLLLRVYLLANKPLLTDAEDRLDLAQSLSFMDKLLSENDLVTVNSLLGTNGTLVASIANAGYWTQLGRDDFRCLEQRFGQERFKFQLQFCDGAVNTCTNSTIGEDIVRARHSSLVSPGAHDLPWGLLGGLRYRSLWADTLQSSDRIGSVGGTRHANSQHGALRQRQSRGFMEAQDLRGAD